MDGMKAWAKARLDALAELDLLGYILKSDSPSCGMERVRIYRATGIPSKDGVGIFARALMELLTVIGDSHRDLVPLVVPLTLLKHHPVRVGVPYVLDQVYLNPRPKELMLRNHV